MADDEKKEDREMSQMGYGGGEKKESKKEERKEEKRKESKGREGKRK